MKSCKFLIVFISVLLLTACMVTKPSYSGLSEKGGYTSQKIDESTYIIEFSKTANERIRIIKAVHYTYWGAAEVAIKNNKKFFKIVQFKIPKTNCIFSASTPFTCVRQFGFSELPLKA